VLPGVTRVTEAPMSWKQGGCHCGAVRYEVLAPDEIEAVECTCSICRKSGYLHYMVAAERFRLLKGDRVVTYSFNTGTAKHHFCATCGVKSFYVPRSMPDGFSVNVRCLDDGAVRVTRITSFDGQNWEQAMTARERSA
jgi:centromere protein V